MTDKNNENNLHDIYRVQLSKKLNKFQPESNHIIYFRCSTINEKKMY